MAKIEIIIKNDSGNTTGKEKYELELGKETLDDIEEAVEKFKNEFLPDIEHCLLNNAQKKVTENIRKKRN